MGNSLKDFLIPKVSAQSDSTAQPTFGPIAGGGGGVVTGSILISSDKTSLDIGETMTVTIEVRTNDISINAMELVLNFDPTYLSPIDADTTTVGTQASVINSVFEVANPQTDNTVGSEGELRVLLTNDSAVQVNTAILEIDFQSQVSGTTSLEIGEGVSGSKLQKDGGSLLAFTTNQVSIDISTEIYDGEEEPEPEPEPEPPVSVPESTPTSFIPDTSIGNGIIGSLPFVVGAIFVLIGISLLRNKEDYEDEY